MRKFTVFAILLLFVLNLSAQAAEDKAQGEINWVTMAEAQEKCKDNPRPIIVDVYTVWCGPCRMLDKNTFHDAGIAAFVNENFYAVKFNAEGKDDVVYNGKTYSNPGFDPTKSRYRNSRHQFSASLQVSGYPTLAFFGSNGDVLSKRPGYRTPEQLMPILKWVLEKNKG